MYPLDIIFDKREKRCEIINVKLPFNLQYYEVIIL